MTIPLKMPESARKAGEMADKARERKRAAADMRRLQETFGQEMGLTLPEGLKLPNSYEIDQNAIWFLKEIVPKKKRSDKSEPNDKGDQNHQVNEPAADNGDQRGDDEQPNDKGDQNDGAAPLTKRESVCYDKVLISGISTDISTGSKKIDLTWGNHGHNTTVTVDRAQVANATHILALASHGLDVTSVNNRALVQYLRALEHYNRAYYRQHEKLVSSRMGWQPTGGFLLGSEYHTTGNEKVSYAPEDGNTHGLAKAYRTQGSLEEWLRIITPAMQCSKHAQLAFYAAHVPPLLDIFQCSNFIVDHSHRTSKGKTTTLRIAASVAGNPDEKQDFSALATWDATPIYIERHLAAINGMPFIVDDTKRAKRPEDVARVLYTAAQGRGKSRAKTHGLATTGTWRTVTISSGEQPATSYTMDGGTRARVLTVTGSPFPDGSHKLVHSLNTGLLQHYGHGYAVFIPWLVMNRDARADEWRKIYDQWLKVFISRTVDNVGARLAAYVAAIYATANIVHQAYEDSGHPLPWYRQDFDDIWVSMQQEAQDELSDGQALADVLAWAITNSNKFEGREDSATREMVGKWDSGDEWQYIAIRQTVLKEFLAKSGYPVRQVLEAWKGNGYLEQPPSRRGYDTNIRLCGTTVPGFVKIKREAFEQATKNE